MKADRIWENVACDEGPSAVLSRELGVSPVTARLLCIRGLGNLDDARRFLSPRLEDLHDPLRLAGMSTAVNRILAAIASKDRIAIHGDYDVDGVTSTVILRRALELLGADVVHFLPERFRDGYGLQPATLDRLHQDGARVVISVDCGIRAAEAANRARELGMEASFLVASIASHGDRRPKEFGIGLTKDAARWLNGGQHSARHTQLFEDHIIPIMVIDVVEQRAGSIRGIGYMDAPLGETPHEEGVDVAEE